MFKGKRERTVDLVDFLKYFEFLVQRFNLWIFYNLQITNVRKLSYHKKKKNKNVTFDKLEK